MQPDVIELLRRCAALRDEIETHAQKQAHVEARARAHELVELLAELRRRQAAREAIELAERTVELLGGLARAQPDAYLDPLIGSITELARSLEHLEQFEAAAAAFGSAAQAQQIAMAARLDAGPEGALALIELLSRRALALAEDGQLATAEREAQAFIELARARLPQALPQLCGGLVFLADLATELARPHETVAHLREAFELLYATLERELPGTHDAVRRLGLRLRDAAGAAAFELPAELTARLDAVLA